MIFPDWLYYLFCLLLFVTNLSGAFLNLLALPGNWMILAASALFALLVRGSGELGLSWSTVGMLVVLALLGEALELFTGIVGAARLKGSRRGMALSIVGSIAGSIMGTMMGLPIPVFGPPIAALVGGALGAFVGAYLGEDWKGASPGQSLAVGQAAFWGRLLGTFGKFTVGVVMVIVATKQSSWG
jgi:uncharacterized protein